MSIEVTSYSLNQSQRILPIRWTRRACCSPEVFSAFGPVVRLTKLPPLLVTFPAEAGGAKIERVLSASACLPPKDTCSKLIKWTADEDLIDRIELPRLYKQYLSLSKSDSVMLSAARNLAAIEVVVAAIGANELVFDIRWLPSVVWPGQVFPVIRKPSSHPVYGGLFSDFLHWKVVSVNKSLAEGTGFVTSSESRVLQAASLAVGLLPKSIRSSVDLGCATDLAQFSDLHKTLSRLMLNSASNVFISGSEGSGKRALVKLAADRAGQRLVETSGFELSSLQDLEQAFEQAKGCVLHLRHFIEAWKLLNWGQTSDLLLRKCLQLLSGAAFVVFSSNEPVSALPGSLRNKFELVMTLEAPNEASRSIVLSHLDEGLAGFARDLAGRSIEELVEFERKASAGQPIEGLLKRGGSLVPCVRWEDIGGLTHAKQDILDTVLLPQQQPELFAGLQPRSGLLLYGPPGTGKTLLAKAVATECSLNFVAVKGPELLSMYVGDSEKNIRDLFRNCRASAPCILFFDELDSLAPARGASADSGKVMERVVAQLLTELDGVRKSPGLFVIAATNRPDLLDPALLRPGRFDKSVFVDVCRDRPSQLKVLQAVTRKFKISSDCDLGRVVQLISLRYSGADFYALSSEALMLAYKETAERLQTQKPDDQSLSDFLESQDLSVEVNFRHFESAARSITPSLSEAELARYRALQQSIESIG